MTTTIAIHAEGLSKRYLLPRRPRARSASLGEALSGLFNRSGASDGRAGADEFWALRDVSFRIDAGERVGIIGRNGAGKSSLLKVLSRITEPSAGRVTVRGRVGSLLEVGTGFHPELSGRENVFLNGAILGMKREEIRRKFDEIVAFAEVEQFLDLPVKRYSSGMYVRLAFAVAAHLEPEILIVDEVLAVGDAAFQKKCLAKMSSVGDAGTTVLFVSHNIATVQHLCTSALFMSSGHLLAHGPVDTVLRQYMEQAAGLARVPLDQRTDRQGNATLRFSAVTLQDDAGSPVPAYRCGQRVRLELGFDQVRTDTLEDVQVSVSIANEYGQKVAELSNGVAGAAFALMPAAAHAIVVELDRLPLMPGAYRLSLECSVAGHLADRIEDAAQFTVEPGDFFGTGRLPSAGSQATLLVAHRFFLSTGAGQ